MRDDEGYERTDATGGATDDAAGGVTDDVTGGATDDVTDEAENEQLTSRLVPYTPLGRLSVRFAAAMLAPVLVFWLFAGQGLIARDGNGGLPAWILLAPAALLGAGAMLTGIVALAREERSLLVYLAASIGATVALSGGWSAYRAF